jgi:pimeloyl-ACP methyl ester carboxylesterase
MTMHNEVIAFKFNNLLFGSSLALSIGMTRPSIFYRTVVVQGLNIAYREAGDLQKPKVVLLHGFPSSSHQYRDLIPALATDFHVIAPDYPGFGNSDMPDPAKFTYTFDKIAVIIDAFLKERGFDRFGLFVQDYGGPVGFRIVTRKPEMLDWLIIQNTNAYEIGFTRAWDGFRGALWKNRSPETEKPLAAFLEEDAIKGIYLHGAKDPERINPDNWKSDFGFMQRDHARRVQLDLFYDYRTNVDLYPKWQAFLKDHQPKTVIFWGQDDVFFTREGGSIPEGPPPRRNASSTIRPLRRRRFARGNRHWHPSVLQPKGER